MRTRLIPVLAVCFFVLSLAMVLAVRAEVPGTAMAAPCDGGDGLYLYADRDYGGACLKITTDTPRLGDLGFNDVTSSIRFVGTFSGGHRFAELYVDGNYGGGIQIIHEDVPWMGNTVVGNDRLSSVRIGFACSGVSQIPQAECQALVDLYNGTHGPSWTARDHWLQTQPCDWYGVYCASGHVQSIILVANNLDGSLPSSLGNLGNLSSLRLSTNRLVGSIPSSLGTLGSLSLLDLSGNGLEGSIPTSLGNLSQLQSLFLYYNALSGAIPSSLGNLGRLEYLYLYHNALTDGIPSSLSSLSRLKFVSLASNELTGNIPDSFRYLKSLVGLYVQDNPLGGALPMSLMEMTALEAFHFEQTGLCEPADAAFQAWLAGMLECGRTGILCSEPSPTPTATGNAVPSATPTGTVVPWATPTRTTVPGLTPTRTATPSGGVARRVYLPVVLRGYSLWTDDEFSGPPLDGRWRWVNEDPAGWSLTERPGYLRIRTHSGNTGDKNLALRSPPPGDWGVRTHVSFAPTTNFQSAGIVVWGGSGSFLRLARAFCDLGPPNCVGDGIYFDRIEGGVWVGSNYALPWPATSPVYLRIERVGQDYHGYCSLDGVHWTWMGSHSTELAVTGVGLTVSQGMPGSPNSADFDWFRVSPVQ